MEGAAGQLACGSSEAARTQPAFCVDASGSCCQNKDTRFERLSGVGGWAAIFLSEDRQLSGLQFEFIHCSLFAHVLAISTHPCF